MATCWPTSALSALYARKQEALHAVRAVCAIEGSFGLGIHRAAEADRAESAVFVWLSRMKWISAADDLRQALRPSYTAATRAVRTAHSSHSLAVGSA